MKKIMPHFTPIVFSIVTYPADSELIESFEYSGKAKGTTVIIIFDHDKETGEVQAKNEL